jgi:flagellar motor switch protein FliG
MDDKGLEDSAILLMSLGEEEASEVFKLLSPKEVQKLGETMAKLQTISRERVESVLERFETVAAQQSSLTANSDEYVKAVLRKALGEEKANLLIDRIMSGSDIAGLESLKWMDAQSVGELIRNEHPQIIATILVHLERYHACDIINTFSERLRNDVVLRIATLDGVQPAALRELNDVLTKLLTGNESLKKQQMGGIRTAAEILNFLSGEIETSVMNNLRAYDEDMAQKIMDEMFVFENILDIDGRGIQMLLREVQSESLIVALKGASQDLREKIFSNMSQRAAEMMREDLESKGPVRLSEVDAQQKAILQIVRRLADEGEIVLGAKGDDAFV